MSTPDGRLSSLSTHTEEFTERTIVPNVMPQLDGPASVCAQRRQPLPMTRRTIIPSNGFPDDSNSNSHDYRSHDNRRYPGRRYQQERGGGPPDREGNQGQGYPGGGGPPDDGGPLTMEDLQEMEDHQEDLLEDKDHQAHLDLLALCIRS